MQRLERPVFFSQVQDWVEKAGGGGGREPADLLGGQKVPREKTMAVPLRLASWLSWPRFWYT